MNGERSRPQPLFHQYSELSFVDATLAAYLQRADIEYPYSFGDDFDAIKGLTRLDTAENPFHCIRPRGSGRYRSGKSSRSDG